MSVFKTIDEVLTEKVPLFKKTVSENKKVLAGSAAAAFIFTLVRADSRARKTQISGLEDEGIRQYLRHQNTDFGSGWRSDEDRPSLGLAMFMAAAAGAIGLHTYKLRNSPDYAKKVYDLLKKVEYKSPFHIASTYRAGEIASSYLPEELRFAEATLVDRFSGSTPKLSLLGEQFQKIFGEGLDVSKVRGEMVFRREQAGSPFLKLAEAKDAAGKTLFETEHSIRFMEKGKLAGSAFRYGMPLDKSRELFQTTIGRPTTQTFMGLPVPESVRPAVEEFLRFKRSQFNFPPNVPHHPSSGIFNGAQYLPVYGKKAGDSALKQVFERAKLGTFVMAERGHETLAHTLGLGLPRGTYNSTTSLMGGLLLKRVLPIAVGIQALRYLDYQTGHHVRNAGAELVARTHLTYGAVTDIVPGLRSAADFNKEAFPGPKYGPLALPFTGGLLGGAYAGLKLLRSSEVLTREARKAQFWKYAKPGAWAGAALMAPFALGMIGSRKPLDQLQREYSGVDQVPVRAGRFWDMGNESFEGGKISFYLPNWYQRLTKNATMQGIYADEGDKWAHDWAIHPLRYLRDPYWLEKKRYHDRPYPITSPAFTNVPIIGDVLAATVGKLIKPPKLMHEGEWSATDYEIGGPKLQPKGDRAKAAEKLSEEFTLQHVVRRQAERFFDWSGLVGYQALRPAFKLFAGNEDLTPYMQGSRQMTNLSKLYYERQFGAMVGLGMENNEQLGYSEPIRRFLINEPKTVQVNEIKNQMPSWLPGEGEYAFNFQAGDIYSKIPFGYMRLPGPGYEALHPELKHVDPESYPSITKLAILADVAPTSSKFYYYKEIVERDASRDMGLQIELDRILNRVEEQQRSATHAYEPKFRSMPDTIAGTVEEATTEGVRLKEYPGRVFKFSGVGLSAADMSAAALSDNNRATKRELVRRTEEKFQAANVYLREHMRPGTRVTATVPTAAADHSTEVPATFQADGRIINRDLLEQGIGQSRVRESGPEAQPMFGWKGKILGSYADQLLRTPSPYFTKLWNARPVEEEYLRNEYYGSKSRSWDAPLQDFLGPYGRGAVYHLTGVPILSEKNERRRDLDTMRDQMQYLRSLDQAAQDPENRARYLGQAARTNIGANLFSTPDRLELTLPRAERPYFEQMRKVTDPERRSRILQYAGPELSRTLSGQWLKQDLDIARAEGKTDIPITPYRGRPVSSEFIHQKATTEGTVVDVIDGDSLVVQDNSGNRREVRLADVNAPEMPTFAGRQAKDRTTQMAMNRHVWMNVTQQGSDKYGRTVAEVFTDQGRFLNDDLMKQGKAGDMQFDSGEWMAKAPSEYQRSREIADFFSRKGLALPEQGSQAYSPDLDYEDVKLKILQEEGYNYHDFGIFQDRAAVLHRKPYLDGAIAELNQPSGRSSESLRVSIEQMIANAYDKNPKVRAIQSFGFGNTSNITINTQITPEEEIRRDIRRRRDRWN